MGSFLHVSHFRVSVVSTTLQLFKCCDRSSRRGMPPHKKMEPDCSQISFSSTMSSSGKSKKSTQTTSKRRRAFVACSNCRKRKIKCVTASDADDDPCTRCSQKGLTCEYAAVSENDSASESSRPNTPSAWYPSQANPPQNAYASIPQFLGTAPALPRGMNHPQAAGTQFYLSGEIPSSSYPYRPYSAAGHTHQPAQPRPQGSFPYTTHPHTAVPHMQSAPPGEAQFYPGWGGQGTHYPSAAPDNGSFYSPGYGQAYAPQGQPANAVYDWLSRISCVCPPGPCYCGANFGQ
ncbi:hypothetical protein DFH07DRAFT_333863 [Mycena maculata]|uniref:Zn(2)-C6 fungal-type domain-containing protein n=1 Tax=Mycena maculata TaxID=230809 RepID=A0AAD7HE46_9AGAR|nr:hypothetical protein DFH07DRAFT_333863 [Mycena maculata]